MAQGRIKGLFFPQELTVIGQHQDGSVDVLVDEALGIIHAASTQGESVGLDKNSKILADMRVSEMKIIFLKLYFLIFFILAGESNSEDLKLTLMFVHELGNTFERIVGDHYAFLLKCHQRHPSRGNYVVLLDVPNILPYVEG